MPIKQLISVFIVLLISGCASIEKNRNAQKELKRLASQGSFTKAIELVKGDDFFPEERSALLKKLELGTLYYLNGQYYQSLKTFDAAKDLSDKLYTESISKMLKSAVTNANQDNYYGEKYERSLLRFYLALLHYQLYVKGEYEAYSLYEKLDNGKVKEKKFPTKKLNNKEKREHLFAARAMILEWDSLLSNYKEVYVGKSIYKTDLMAKVFGAFIHEQIGSRTDKNIAKKLYQKAKDVLFKYYNLYPTYNAKYKTFAEDYDELPKLKKSKVVKEYVVPTEDAKKFLTFINQRIKALSSKDKDNLKIILKDGFVARKIARKIDFPLPMIGLGYVSGKKTDLLTFTFELLSISHGTKPTISYELPGIEKQHQDFEYYAVVQDEKGKEIKRAPIYLINPVSDIAWQNLDNKTSSLNAKIGARVAAKHVAAILAAYKIYESRPDALGKIAAGLSYAAANKAIAASEKVDLRQWSTLPQNMRVGSLYLKPNRKYQLLVEAVRGKDKFFVTSQAISVTKNKVTAVDLNLFGNKKITIKKIAQKK